MSPAVSSSTRWCPTPEQLMILEEMYRSGGVKTPNATQIQQITTHLSHYGKIEGKNVFYWFQNHKARDRQKLRRKLINKHHHHQQKQHIHSNNLQLPPQHHQQLVYHHVHHHQPHNASSSSMAPGRLQQFSHFTAAINFYPQGGIVGHDEKGSTISAGANHTWKVDEMMMMERMYGEDWSMMKSNRRVGPTDSSENRPVMRTLELFPTKATNLKEECCSNNNNNNAVATGHHGSSLFFI